MSALACLQECLCRRELPCASCAPGSHVPHARCRWEPTLRVVEGKEDKACKRFPDKGEAGLGIRRGQSEGKLMWN